MLDFLLSCKYIANKIMNLKEVSLRLKPGKTNGYHRF